MGVKNGGHHHGGPYSNNTSINHNHDINEDIVVDLNIEDEDYEMFAQNLMDSLKITFEENKFHEFNRIAKKEYEMEMKHLSSDTVWVKGNEPITEQENDNQVVTVIPAPVHRRKREASKTVTEVFKIKEYYKNTEESNSPSDDIYYRPAKNGNFESGFQILDSFRFIIYPNCTVEDSSGIGIKALQCLFSDCKEHRESYKVLVLRICIIAVIWLLVYLALAIPLWCTRGWFCCCLSCKFFKPQETIKEAKNYILLNPPGILVTKRGGIIHYEPTEREKDCYEEFGHFIRTL